MELRTTLHRLRTRLSQPEDASALVVFRMGFGLIMFFDMLRYGWYFNVSERYANTDFHFKYLGFGWVEAPPGDGLQWLLTGLAVLAAMIATGFLYRWATLLFTLGFTWFFLMDRAQYLNHFYMVWLFCVIMCIVPANRMWSLDSRLRRVQRSTVSPVWARWLLVAQLEIILIYAGLVKLNPDWLNLAPLEQWLAKRDDLWLVGELFTQRWAVALAAYGVIALHLVGAPLLLFKQTRVYVLVVYASFHCLNHFVFTIGIFPWMTLFASLLCLEPDWPRRAWSKVSGAQYLPQPVTAPAMSMTPLLVGFIAIWLTVQVLLPLRHFTYDGDVAWNDKGHLFSWRMKLRSQRGDIMFLVRDRASNQAWLVDPYDYLTSKQVRKMRCRPDMILQFAGFLSEEFERELDIDAPAVHAENRCSLNYRPHTAQVNPEIDLTTIKRTDSMNTWIFPLKEQLPNRIIGWARVDTGE